MAKTDETKHVKLKEEAYDLIRQAKIKFLKQNPKKQGYDYEVIEEALKQYIGDE